VFDSSELEYIGFEPSGNIESGFIEVDLGNLHLIEKVCADTPANPCQKVFKAPSPPLHVTTFLFNVVKPDLEILDLRLKPTAFLTNAALDQFETDISSTGDTTIILRCFGKMAQASRR